MRDMEKTKKGIKPDGLMGKVKQAFEAAGLLNDEKMFSGGECLIDGDRRSKLTCR